MIYTNAHRSALNERLMALCPGMKGAAYRDGLHLLYKELPKGWAMASDDDETERMARAFHREYGWQMPVLIKINNISSGELRHEYLVNYIDYRNRRDMRDMARLIKEKKLFFIANV